MLSLPGDRLDAAGTVLGTSDARRTLLMFVALGCVVASESPKRAARLDVPLRLDHQLTCRQALSWLGVVNLAVLAAWGGHSALDGSTNAFSVLAKTGHLVGLGLWIGVLAVVLAISTSATSCRAAMSAMSGTALVGAFLTVVSGLALASKLVVSMTAVTATPYGAALLAKTGLIALAAVLGVMMRRRSAPHWSYGELGVLTAVVLLGAAMATATPAVDPGFTNDPPAVAGAPTAVRSDDLLLQARAIPARPGANTVELRIGETRRPSLGPVSSVDITVDGEEHTTTPDTHGLAFVDAVTLPTGTTAMSVVVHRVGWPDTRTTLTVATEAVAYVHPPWISSSRIRRPLLALASIVATIGLLLWRARRRGAFAGSDPGVASAVSDRPLSAQEARLGP
jgi:copper transport protein